MRCRNHPQALVNTTTFWEAQLLIRWQIQCRNHPQALINTATFCSFRDSLFNHKVAITRRLLLILQQVTYYEEELEEV